MFDLDVWYPGTPVMLSRLLSDISMTASVDIYLLLSLDMSQQWKLMKTQDILSSSLEAGRVACIKMVLYLKRFK